MTILTGNKKPVDPAHFGVILSIMACIIAVILSVIFWSIKAPYVNKHFAFLVSAPSGLTALLVLGIGWHYVKDALAPSMEFERVLTIAISKTCFILGTVFIVWALATEQTSYYLNRSNWSPFPVGLVFVGLGVGYFLYSEPERKQKERR